MSIRFVVGRPVVQSPCQVIPKDFKNGIHSFPAWHSAFKGCCGEQASKLACCVLRQGTPPLCGRQWPGLERDGLCQVSQPKICCMMNTTKTNWSSAVPQRQSPLHERKNNKSTIREQVYCSAIHLRFLHVCLCVS